MQISECTYYVLDAFKHLFYVRKRAQCMEERAHILLANLPYMLNGILF